MNLSDAKYLALKRINGSFIGRERANAGNERRTYMALIKENLIRWDEFGCFLKLTKTGEEVLENETRRRTQNHD